MATRSFCSAEDKDETKLGEFPKAENFVRKGTTLDEYTEIFRNVVAKWLERCKQFFYGNDNVDEIAEDLILPSNEDWRYRVYYQLVELQREYDSEFATKRVGEVRSEAKKFAEKTEEMRRSETEKDEVEQKWEWEPKIRKLNCLKAKVRNGNEEVHCIRDSMTEERVQPGWLVNDILLAAEILRKTQPFPKFSDEAEMRRVFGLVYDVLRYKKIFDRALKDTGFWRRNAAIKDREKIVWLLLYDMQGRKFSRQTEIDAVQQRKKIFEAAELTDIEDALLEAKTHLAASISRLRIRGSALSLNELLPSRLREIEGVAWGEKATIASGWVNTAKLSSKKQFLEQMSKLGLTCREDSDTTIELDETSYVFDSICPKTIYLHERAREALAVSSLVRDHNFVFLERSLCIGAAALVKAIRIGHFCGPVILTHSLAPRHTGYLAGLLTDIEHPGRLLAFGAGNHRCEYETYLRDLGVTLQRCRVFSEKYVSHLATAELERATVVLAVPPCSYTGVKDIVDLAVARGGDSDLLESLTNAYASDDECNDHQHPQAFLDDQMSTLKYALTRPNVQFLIYEVHTILPSETTEMVKRVVDYVNRIAIEKYLREHPKISKEPKDGSTISANVTVPDSDLFEIGSIDDIYGKNASCALDPGCFLAVIKRKEIMQFDSLFMIKVAESKGLFGESKEQQEAKQQPLIPNQSPPRISQISVRKRAKRIKIELDRIMTHTYSSLSRSTKENRICPRHQRYNDWKDTMKSTTQVSENFNGKENSTKTWQDQKMSANRLSTPVRAEPPRKKERTQESRLVEYNFEVTDPYSSVATNSIRELYRGTGRTRRSPTVRNASSTVNIQKNVAPSSSRWFAGKRTRFISRRRLKSVRPTSSAIFFAKT